MKTLAMTSPEPTTGHRFVTLASWALPGTVLALLPKCPACFAAYAALWTGVGLSMPVASGLRLALMVVCVASLAFLAFRLVRRALARRPHAHQEVSQVVCYGGLYDHSQATSPFAGTAGTTGTTELGKSTIFIRP